MAIKKHIYKRYVDTKSIKITEDTKNNLRNLLEVPIRNNGNKSVLVILKNPSKATNNQSDYTVNKVIEYCKRKDYNKVYIMNLFSYYSTKPKGVKIFINSNNYTQFMEKNLSVLEETIANVDDVIEAWGTDTIGCKKEYDKTIKKVNEILQKEKLKSGRQNLGVYYVGNLSNKGNYPLHGQRWEYNMKMICIK